MALCHSASSEFQHRTAHASMNKSPDVPRFVAGIACVGCALLCLAYAYWRRDLPDWWRASGGGIPYVMFWCALRFVVFPFRRCVALICIGVTAFTCVLEFLQLWQPVWLMNIRATRFGAALLGSGFSWHDFPPYFIGGVLGALLLWVICGIPHWKKEG